MLSHSPPAVGQVKPLLCDYVEGVLGNNRQQVMSDIADIDKMYLSSIIHTTRIRSLETENTILSECACVPFFWFWKSFVPLKIQVMGMQQKRVVSS